MNLESTEVNLYSAADCAFPQIHACWALALRLRTLCRYQGVHMCGIAGLLSLSGKPVSQEEVQLMCDAMAHRGPNDDGYYAGPEAVLGMRRLSIIDIEGGHQPVHNEDRTIWVVFNGEIYNFKSLRVALERQGHRFYTDTDTEVIVHLYEQYGKSCVDKMRGMFAF